MVKVRATPLTPLELATGAVMGSFTVGLTVIASIVPLAAALQIVAAIPMAIVAQRHRPRALIAAAVSATLVAFVAAGTTSAIAVVSCALLGGIVGDVKRRGRGLPTVLLSSAILGPATAAFSVLLLLILTPLRTLFLTILRNSIEGTASILDRSAVLIPTAKGIRAAGDSIIANWYIWVFVSITISTVIGALATWFILRAVLDRLAGIPAEDQLTGDDASVPASPLPVRFEHASFRYPKSQSYALTDLNFSLHTGQFLAVVGANGSGKSTLARLLAGRPPTSGSVSRPGSAGLGKFGGTAVVLQHPESQILGTRVADDVVWGLPASSQHTTDVDALLREVGLADMGSRETASLSGGEMQRLAVAGALARQPALIVADEATTMVDRPGRRALVDLLVSLPRRHPTAVVLVTHQETEAVAADYVLHLRGGYQVPHQSLWMNDRPHYRYPPAPPIAGPPLLALKNVRHTYNNRTPWSREALRGIDISLQSGEGLLIVGGNGSGKSTLAWIIAGLLSPTSGTAELGGRATTRQVGSIGLAFQHSRLQIQKRTVAEDIVAAGGPEVGSTQVSRAMDAVGLERSMAGRSVDELSGGQMRRLVLAGLIAARPRLLVLDEPLAGLDPPGRRAITQVLAQLRSEGMSIVVISHDIEGMETVCNRSIALSDGLVVVPASSPQEIS